ncbi:hypothetical protein AAZX31_11G040900 [Glycine max]|uniref:Uncharacterized protein n=3 Tax=Glycine subgen. Soja TaxID=1462606 RepID=K7LN00_SOYBN|nr:uncharacterized protein LOC114376300 [Glycine soja]XP_028190167.1 uncharacterized protein LOC114376300 [Glycine soja]KAG4987672.1 hypothetical protein JHK85_030655 [Glycine max]KAG4993293.1 hypothetical protein JHK86_030120 [Glycine max]KAG5123296.1 hypothetical protein JHK82_030033 [Glycine max]KAG5144711.1 hypothetical protein JHK84_030254 [Glycine max]KAH1157537.1 hypothetical protein GYH30_029986 [Glycine max]
MMKLSLKLDGENEKQNLQQQQHSSQIMTAKVPISILNKPFLSGVTASTGTHSPSEFSFSLSTNFPSGPSLRLSYSPTASAPFSLSLKSGLGLLGSPAHSPLVFSANFSLSPTPSFFLHFKPRFGHFSLHKTVFSDTITHTHSLSTSFPPTPEIVPHGSSTTGWHNLKLEPSANSDQSNNNTYFENFKNDAKNALSPGVRVMARTVMPVTKGFLLNFRWGVNFPRNFGSKMPSLTVNKIGLERVEEGKEKKNNNDDKKQMRDSSGIDLKLLKGMCFWMGRDLEIMEKENREMKRLLDEMKLGISSTRNSREESNGSGWKLSESNGEVQRWRSYKSERQEDEKKVQPNKPLSVATTDVESELEKAIKAATSTS